MLMFRGEQSPKKSPALQDQPQMPGHCREAWGQAGNSGAGLPYSDDISPVAECQRYAPLLLSPPEGI